MIPPFAVLAFLRSSPLVCIYVFRVSPSPPDFSISSSHPDFRRHPLFTPPARNGNDDPFERKIVVVVEATIFFTPSSAVRALRRRNSDEDVSCRIGVIDHPASGMTRSHDAVIQRTIIRPAYAIPEVRQDQNTMILHPTI